MTRKGEQTALTRDDVTRLCRLMRAIARDHQSAHSACGRGWKRAARLLAEEATGVTHPYRRGPVTERLLARIDEQQTKEARITL